MPLMLLAKMEDDTGFIITLGVVLLAVICWLVLGQDQTIRLQDAEEAAPDTDEFRQNCYNDWIALTICSPPSATAR